MESLISLIADGLVFPVAIIGAGVLIWYVPNNKKYEVYTRIIMGGLTAYLFAKLIGSIYQPSTARPFELLGTEAGASFLNNPGFPSDHMLFCVAITLAVWYGTRMKKTTLVLAALTLAVGVGRVLALVHTPLDVIGGAVIAMLGAVWYLDESYLKSFHFNKK